MQKITIDAEDTATAIADAIDMGERYYVGDRGSIPETHVYNHVDWNQRFDDDDEWQLFVPADEITKSLVYGTGTGESTYDEIWGLAKQCVRVYDQEEENPEVWVLETNGHPTHDEIHENVSLTIEWGE